MLVDYGMMRPVLRGTEVEMFNGDEGDTDIFMDWFSRFEDNMKACRIPYSERQRILVLRPGRNARRFATGVQNEIGNIYEEMIRAFDREFSPLNSQKYRFDLSRAGLNPDEGILSFIRQLEKWTWLAYPEPPLPLRKKITLSSLRSGILLQYKS